MQGRESLRTRIERGWSKVLNHPSCPCPAAGMVVVLTFGVPLHLPESPDQPLVALQAAVVLAVQQDLLSIVEQTGDSGRKDGKDKRFISSYSEYLLFYFLPKLLKTDLCVRVCVHACVCVCTHIESLKLPTTPGVSPGVG